MTDTYNAYPTAREIMDKNFAKISVGTKVHDVIRLMNSSGKATVIVTENKEGADTLAGEVTELDCITCLAGGKFKAHPEITVTEAMRISPLCVKPETNIMVLAYIMIEHSHNKVIVTQGIEPIGIVTRKAVMESLYSHYQDGQHDPLNTEVPPIYGVLPAASFIVS